MSCRAVYGHLTGLVATARLRGVVTVPAGQETALRCAGYRVGKVFKIVAREGGMVTLRRVRETRWGVNKARVTALDIGSTLTVPTLRQVQLLYKGANYAGIKISYRRQGARTFLVTRTA